MDFKTHMNMLAKRDINNGVSTALQGPVTSSKFLKHWMINGLLVCHRWMGQQESLNV